MEERKIKSRNIRHQVNQSFENLPMREIQLQTNYNNFSQQKVEFKEEESYF